ncbi:MAG: tagaturonate reductase [Eubacteriales bacterium]|nr:tagaturonate reductase [Eubacteriales bacterium]
MNPLRYDTLPEQGAYVLRQGTERFLQFGEGNFLRGFADCFIDQMNERLGLDSKVIVVQPIEAGLADQINAQQGLYHLYLRGGVPGDERVEKRLISAISRAVDPYRAFAEFLACARQPDLRFLISNTTEAGISCRTDDRLGDRPAASFPGKLTQLLWERYQHYGEQAGKGFVILSCELIDHNGRELRACVETYARRWELPDGFFQWLDRENLFCDTLVDRIITGYPRADAEALNRENGVEDGLLDTGEPFAFWAIEGPDWLKEALPFEKAGLPVAVVSDQSYYKKRKVRILNGAQTGISLAAYLMGCDISLDYMARPDCVSFVRRIIYDEVIPFLQLDEQDMLQFADEVMVRLNNPFIRHSLLAISLNSVSKWKARVWPSLLAYWQGKGQVPPCIAFSLAALLEFYRIRQKGPDGYFGLRNGQPYRIQDDNDVLEFFWNHRADAPRQLVRVCAQQILPEIAAIPPLAEQTAELVRAMREHGINEVFASVTAPLD